MAADRRGGRQTAARGPIPLSASLQLTGAGAVYGDWARKSLTFGVTEANDAGGVLGHKRELVIEDVRSG